MRIVEPTKNVQKTEHAITKFLGFNNTETISENEFLDQTNMSSLRFPSISPRLSRELISTITTPNGAISFNGALYTVSGTDFLKDGVVKGTVANSRKCLIEFNLNILIFPDLKFYDTVGGTFGAFTSGTLNPIANPAMDYATVHNNRVFGVKGQNIYASKLGNFKEFNVFAGLDSDSWATDVAGAVQFITIGTYQNHVVLQSTVNMFEIYGTKPSNFQVVLSTKYGSSVKAYAEVAGVLYFGNRDGVYSFSGGQPRKITTSIVMDFQDVEVGGDSRFLYINVYDGTRYHLFVYDTETSIISREDDINVLMFFVHNFKTYALLENGKLYRFGTGSEVVNWSITTSEFSDFMFTTNSVKQVEIHAEMAVDSSINIYVKADNDLDYWLVKNFVAEQNRTLLIPIIMYKNAYSIRIDGVGFVKINAIKRTVQQGGAI